MNVSITLTSATKQCLSGLFEKWGLEEDKDWVDRTPDNQERRNVLIRLDSENLEIIFEELERLAKSFWKNQNEDGKVDPGNPDSVLLDFMDVFFPSSTQRILPGRQLRGAYAKYICGMHDRASPINCNPGAMLRVLKKKKSNDVVKV